ncbi:hypothetical protein BDW22DRAFT_428306 [Trametopsis cervina]|nr:hypothetical protein BDW22DRAFT_428306 [Trametopsis cervina]
MAPLSLAALLVLLLGTCYAEIVALQQYQQPRTGAELAPRLSSHDYRSAHTRDRHASQDQLPPGGLEESPDLLDIVLLASVDGKLHALNRTSGESLWSMSSSATSSQPTPLAPLVRTKHPVTTDAADHDGEQEVYIIEPQSGDIYVLSSPNSPLQRLPLSMAQLVELSPYSIYNEDNTKVFVGKKETSLLLVELETGRIKATLSSEECPWDPFEDLSRDKDHLEEDEVDLDELEGSKPRRIKSTSTEVFIGRTDYHISIFTRPSDPTFPRPPVQNLSFSTYGPNNQDQGYQTMYRHTPDGTYVQSMANGKIMSFQTDLFNDEEDGNTRPLWAKAYKEPIVATFDVLRVPSRPHPFVLQQPRLSLHDLLPKVDLAAAAKDNRLPNLEAAYVGIVEENGSLYVLSPDRYPLVVFGDTNTFEEQHGYGSEYGVGRSAGRLIDPPGGLGSSPDDERDFPADLDSITRHMKRKKLKEMCLEPGVALKDKRCLTGVRKMETSRLSRLLDGSATVPLPFNSSASEQDTFAGGVQPASPYDPPAPGNGSMTSPARGNGQGRPGITDGQTPTAQTAGMYALGTLSLVLAIVLAWVLRTRHSPPVPAGNNFSPSSSALVDTNKTAGDDPVVVSATGVEPLQQDSPLPTVAPVPPTPISPDQPATPKSTARKVSFGEALKVEPVQGEDAEEDLPDGGAEGDDSENDISATPGRKKPLRRRRGKKKPKNVAVNGDTAEEAVPSDDKAKEDDARVIPSGSMLILPPSTPTPAAPSLIVSDTILGFGSHGTVVFKGSLQGRAVAVKRLLQDFVTLAAREVTVLQESDDHPNVIRYYYQEAQANFLYIALELCPASLADIIERPDQFRDISIAFDPKRALRQVTSGLRHLHALKIIHRDIKPQNILISHAKKGAGDSAGHRMLISDFGLCKKLEVDQTSFLPTAHGAMAAGTVGWRAPEILRGEVRIDDSGGDESQSSRGSAYGSESGVPPGRLTRLTKSVDIFALGCLFYYVLTNGGHPFGDRYEREANIFKDAKCLEGLERFGEEGSEAVDLITRMLSPEASQRPDTSTCLLHPYFWDSGKRLNFLQEASDRFEIMCRDPRDPLLVELETGALGVVGSDWNARLDKWFIETLGKYRKYDGKSVQDLMRALRNKKHHYQDLPDNVKRQIGSMPEGFLSYFTRRFPRLFLHVHTVVSSSQLRGESMFRSYFELSES